MNERLLRARLDSETRPRVELWRERRAQDQKHRFIRDYGVVIGWVVMVISSILTGFLVVYLF